MGIKRLIGTPSRLTAGFAGAFGAGPAEISAWRPPMPGGLAFPGRQGYPSGAAGCGERREGRCDAAWACWKSGGTCPGISYQAAGMQSLVDAVRGASAHNLVLLGGVAYSNALTQWVAHAPTDPDENIAAAWHVYNFNGCADTTCYDKTAGVVAQSYPIVTTEIGEDDCSGNFITTLMTWLDGKKQSYLGWVWDDWGGCLVLISDYGGTAAGAYGTAFKTHVMSIPH